MKPKLAPTLDALDRIAFDRLGVVALADGHVTPGTVVAALAELADVGVTVAHADAANDNLANAVPALVAHVRKRRGKRGRRRYSPLFKGFPDRLPAFDDFELRVQFAVSRLGIRALTGATVDEWRAALDFTDIGWWPASSVPSDPDQARLDRAAQANLPRDTRVEWLTIRLVPETERKELLIVWMATALASATSLRGDVRADVETLARQFGVDRIDSASVRFRENRILLYRLAWEQDPASIVALSPTPDDLLRLFASLTDGDVSLTEKVKYPRLTRGQRRAVVAALESTPRLPDVFRRRGLWLALDRGLHLGEFEAPRTQDTFARLRDTRHDRESLPSRFEALVAAGDHASAARLLGDEAPGLLVRNLRRLLALSEVAGDVEGVITAFDESADRVPLRLLLTVRAQLADNGATYPRIAFGKAGAPMLIDRTPGHLRLHGSHPVALTAVDAAIDVHLSTLDSWASETVYIDPTMDQVLVPVGLRATADGLVQAERGTRLPSGRADVLRLFVHWRHSASDLDLSCVALDENFDVVEFVSWTQLRSGAMVHSGDITSAPDGAEEFIDIDLATARTHEGWRYLAPVVFRYSGPNFASLDEATVGWMLRDTPDGDRQTFDPASVVNAFSLTGRARYAVPFCYDLAGDGVLYVDTYMRGEPRAMVERDARSLSTLVRTVSERARLRPNVADLAALHMAARGASLTDDRAAASISFALDDDATYNPLRPERLLAELL